MDDTAVNLNLETLKIVVLPFCSQRSGCRRHRSILSMNGELPGWIRTWAAGNHQARDRLEKLATVAVNTAGNAAKDRSNGYLSGQARLSPAATPFGIGGRIRRNARKFGIGHGIERRPGHSSNTDRGRPQGLS